MKISAFSFHLESLPVRAPAVAAVGLPSVAVACLLKWGNFNGFAIAPCRSFVSDPHLSPAVPSRKFPCPNRQAFRSSARILKWGEKAMNHLSKPFRIHLFTWDEFLRCCGRHWPLRRPFARFLLRWRRFSFGRRLLSGGCRRS